MTCPRSAATSPPTVIHVLTTFDFGGVERHMEVIAGALSQARFRHVFVAIGKGGAAEHRVRALGAEVICLGLRPRIPARAALWVLYRLFRQYRPQVVHTHGAEGNFHGLLAAALARVPVRIGEEIGIPGHSALAKSVFRVVYLCAHRVIGVSAVVAEWLVQHREVSSGRLVQIDNPVRLPEHMPANAAPADVFRIVFVGRLEPVKNPLLLLESFAALHRNGVHCELWFVGEGSQRDLLDNRITQLGIASEVRLLGFQDEPADWVRQCHICVLPSVSEGFSLAIVEVMGCGLPVISTVVGIAPEIIRPGESGWLLAEPTVAALTHILEQARQMHPDQLAAMGRRAMETVQGRFDPERYLHRIEHLYAEVSRGNG